MKTKRLKVNFMIDQVTLIEMKELVPDGERSDFVNRVLTQALTDFGRRKALKNIKKFREKMKFKVSTQEIIDAKNHGRK